ncbi:putative ArsR-family transcriptional regulator [Marmoricola endophyticus]|uniref:ArsR-family transcriptional regulator n=1 Tax=Marmoricola endophyticus TaxID=2040280 RepID=A0A917BMG0_9ACTN|nr:metalloregulator ArsR/SmtB family transcription factor [Marmoricola endophyticus]GGF50564.1 putative ArsR-family transcriptional regulator [Marmoricola endophyticus]
MATDAHRRDLEEDFGPVAELFAALAVPVRAAIVHRLTEHERSVGELVETLGVSQPLVSQHLRTLRLAGLVSVEREGRRAVYRLTDAHVAHVFLDAYHHSREPGDG